MSSEHPFVDPVTGRQVVLHFGDAPGVEHPGCRYRAEVQPELDAFFCRHCGRNGRISGAWFMDLLAAAEAPTPYRREALVSTIVYHQRTRSSGCSCGWGVLGHSFAEHVADVYELVAAELALAEVEDQ